MRRPEILPLLIVFLIWIAEASSSYETNFSLPIAQRYVTFSGIAYYSNPILKKDSVETWSCHACKTFPNVNAKSFHGTKTDANGFVGFDSDANEIIVSFSGAMLLLIIGSFFAIKLACV